jgi:hypothetical protein
MAQNLPIIKMAGSALIDWPAFQTSGIWGSISIKAPNSFHPVSPLGWVGPSAHLKSVVLSIPGALRQADMDRASGPLEMVPTVNPHLIEETKAPLHPIVSSHLEV